LYSLPCFSFFIVKPINPFFTLLNWMPPFIFCPPFFLVDLLLLSSLPRPPPPWSIQLSSVHNIPHLKIAF
jgi:hypothetical protein